MLPPKKPTTKKFSPVKKYKKTSSGDSLAEDIFEFLDPTGISSYDDVYRSYKKNGLLSLDTGLEILGALPIIGKGGKILKGLNTTSRLLNKVNKVNKIVSKTDKVIPKVLSLGTEVSKDIAKYSKVGKANPIGITAKVVGKGGENLIKLEKAISKTTGKAVDKTVKLAPQKEEVIKTAFATLNTANTTSSAAQFIPEKETTPQVKETVKPKVAYYNTNSKHGKVETPGNEEGVQYVPVSNSVQLEKWKNQKLAFGTGENGIGDPPNRLTFENELMSRVITERNKDKNFVQRALNPSDYPVIVNEDGSETTHLMQYSTDDNGNAYVSPTVIQNQLGLLSKLNEDEAVQYGAKSGEEIMIPNIDLADYYTKNGLIKHAYGTNSQGIMKKKMNFVKRYANGTDAKGMDPNHYIISPAEALNDYNIMLAEAEAKANNNPWLPIVGIAGQVLQTGIGIAGKAAIAKAGAGGKFKVGEGFDEPNKEIDLEAINKFNFSSDNASLEKGTTAAMGNNNVQKDVEVEGGEMYETPQGQVGEFKGPSHEAGGIPLEVGKDVEQGTKVYSDRLKIGEKTLAERKATRERQIANLEKIASNNLADEAVKNAAKRKMQAIQKEEAADLQFQDQVNNLQAMADTMVQTFAYGTGMKGVQKMDKGGIIGEPKYDKFGNPIVDIASLLQTPGVIPSNQIDYSTNYQSLPKTDLNAPSVKEAPVIDLTDPKNNPANYETNIIKNLHDALGITPDTPGYGTAIGPLTSKLYRAKLKEVNPKAEEENIKNSGQNYVFTKEDFENFKDSNIGLSMKEALKLTNLGQKYKGGKALLNDDTVSTITEDQLLAGTEEAMRNADAESDMAFYTPGQVGTPIVKEETKKEPSKLAKALEDNIPAVGDITKLIGNYLGMTAGIKTAAEQRSTDVTHRNVFANAGEESQRLLDNAKQGIETSKAQAIVKATTVGRGGKKGARGSARGVNTMRATDWLYDTALQEQIAQISASAAQQIAGIDTQKSSVAMSADQLKGQGEYQAAMANEAAKDAYYTALGQGRKDFATGMQQTGKDLNDMKQNKIVQNLLSQYGQWFKVNADGTLANKNETKTTSKNNSKNIADEEIELTDKSGKKIKVSKTLLEQLSKATNQ